MTELDHPVYAYARACPWDWAKRAAAFRARGLHPLVAAIMAHEDTAPPIPREQLTRSTYDRSRARRNAA